MVKAKAKKVPTHQTIKLRSGRKASAFGKRGGKIAKGLAKKIFEQKKANATTPPDWPTGWIVDDRWCSWLPLDWTPAIKTTANGCLLHGCVGPPPERKPFFHKVDLARFLGRTLALTERGPKPPEATCGNYDPNLFIKRLPVAAVAPYINNRLDKVHGLSVEEAVNLSCWHGGLNKEKRYTTTDLKYDIKCNRLTLVPQRPSQSSRPVVAPATPSRQRASPSTPGRSGATSAPATPTERRTMAAPATPVKQPRNSAAPSTPAASSAGSQGTRSGRKDGPSVADVFRSCYVPLKRRAASGIEAEKAILAMQGIGFTLGLDATMLKTLPDVLRKMPAERGEFGNFVLDELEKAVAKA